MTCETTPHLRTLQPNPVGLHGAMHLFARLSTWLAARRGREAVRRLATFDDRMLADIGLQRSDLDAAVEAPWDVDPTVVLAVRRRRHRDAEMAGVLARKVVRKKL